MGLRVGSSQNEVFRSLIDYFVGRRIRVLTSVEPSYIRVGIGSFVSLSLGNAKGDVAVYIGKTDGGSSLNFDFDFSKDYSVSFIIAICGALVVYAFLSWVANMIILTLPPSLRVGAWSTMFLFLIFLALLTFTIIIVIESYSVSTTKRKFIEELTMFTQSLKARK